MLPEVDPPVRVDEPSAGALGLAGDVELDDIGEDDGVIWRGDGDGVRDRSGGNRADRDG